MFFRRLEIYIEVPPTTEMMDIIIQIVVEVLSILGIATKEIKQGPLSEYLLRLYNTTTLTEVCSEKYARRLTGRSKIEDSLKRLDRLTQEEARMASAQNLKISHTVDESVRGVGDTVVSIDNRVVIVDGRVASVDDRVAEVSDKVASVKDRVVTVDDRIKVVDNKVTQVIAGA